MKKTALTLLLALVGLSTPVLAQTVPANVYECQGDGVAITYSTTSMPGQPIITVDFGKTTIARSGDEIQTQDTVLGALVTIQFPSLPDAPLAHPHPHVPRVARHWLKA